MPADSAGFRIYRPSLPRIVEPRPPLRPEIERLEAVLEFWPIRAKEAAEELERVCRERASRACRFRGLRDSVDVEDVASACFVDAIESIARGAPAKELFEVITRTADTRAARTYRRKRRERQPHSAPERESVAATLPSEWQELGTELLAIFEATLSELERSHPRYARDWRSYAGRSISRSDREWPSRRSTSELREAMVRVLEQRTRADERKGIPDGLSDAMLQYLRGSSTKARYAAALHALLEFLGPPPGSDDEAR